MQDRNVLSHSPIELARIVTQVLKRLVTTFERMNPNKHLERDHRKREPIRLDGEVPGMPVANTFHKNGRGKRWSLIAINIDEEEVTKICRDKKVHLIQIDDEKALAMHVGHTSL